MRGHTRRWLLFVALGGCGGSVDGQVTPPPDGGGVEAVSSESAGETTTSGDVVPIPARLEEPVVPDLPPPCPAGQFPHLRSGCQAAGIRDCAELFRGVDGVCLPQVSFCPPGTLAMAPTGCVSFPADEAPLDPADLWSEVTDPGGLVASLAQAPPDARVRLGPGDATGTPLTILRSVTLRGAGAALTRLDHVTVGAGVTVTLEHVTVAGIVVGAGGALELADVAVDGTIHFESQAYLRAERSRLEAAPGLDAVTYTVPLGLVELFDSNVRGARWGLDGAFLRAHRAVIELDTVLVGPGGYDLVDTAVITSDGIIQHGGGSSRIAGCVLVASRGTVFQREYTKIHATLTVENSLIRGPSGIRSFALVSRGNVFEGVTGVALEGRLLSSDDTFLLRSGVAVVSSSLSLNDAYVADNSDKAGASPVASEAILVHECPSCDDRRVALANVVIEHATECGVRVQGSGVELTARRVRIERSGALGTGLAAGLIVTGRGRLRVEDLLVRNAVGVGIWLGDSVEVDAVRLRVEGVQPGRVIGVEGPIDGVADGLLATSGATVRLDHASFVDCSRLAVTVVEAAGVIGRARAERCGGDLAQLRSPAFLLADVFGIERIETPVFDQAPGGELAVASPPTLVISTAPGAE